MSTHWNIMLTFSNLETFQDYRIADLDCDAAWKFKERLHKFQNKVFLFVDQVHSTTGIVYVIGWSKRCPDAEFREVLKSIDWVEPEAIQVQFQNGDSDMDQWRHLELNNLVERAAQWR